MSHPTTYAVDFDGTLCENAYPEIGAPNLPLIDKLISRRRLGAKIILWTPWSFAAATGWNLTQ